MEESNLIPKIGMGATLYHFSDSEAFTVQKIFSPKKIGVTKDISLRTDKNGMSDIQEYSYTENKDAQLDIFTLRKNGFWHKQCSSNNSSFLILGYRKSYYDYTL